jgi:AraC-like DNA-binding protein
MRALFEKILFPTGTSIRLEEVNGFHAPYSYHPEYEIVYILSGKGTRLIGLKPEPFSSGDLVLLGPNVCHWWKPYENPRVVENEKAIVVQWGDMLMENTLLNCKEFQPIKEMLKNSLHGLRFPVNDSQLIIEKIISLKNCNPAHRLLRLIEILLDMNDIKQMHKLDGLIGSPNSDDTPPVIERAIIYILENLHKPISQQSIATHFNLSQSHFSRIFKQTTDMSFPKFLNDNRITAICESMSQKGKNIADLAFTYGYENLSTFNRTFKEKMGMTPLTYRKTHYNH